MKTAAIFAAALVLAAAPSLAADPVVIPVTAGPGQNAPLSGRLIVFAQRVEPGAAAQDEVDSSPFHPTDTAVAAREIEALRPGQVAQVDGETELRKTRKIRAGQQVQLGDARIQLRAAET